MKAEILIPMSTEKKSITGTVVRVTFHNRENHYSVLVLETDEGREISAVGTVDGPAQGEYLECTGTWDKNPKFGLQFKIDSFTRSAPTDKGALADYLSSGIIAGVGPAMAERMVERFGNDIIDVLDNRPHELQKVQGIGKKTLSKITKSWQAQSGMRDIGMFLGLHGINRSLAKKIYEEYGSDALQVVKEDPYRLVMEVEGIGFLTADTIARKTGSGYDSPGRIEAGILHILNVGAAQGHVFLRKEEVEKNTIALLENVKEPSVFESALQRLSDDFRIKAEKNFSESENDQVLYLPAHYRAETGTASSLARLISASTSEVSREESLETVKVIEKELSIDFAPEQVDAITGVLDKPVTVITGGPGTGKSTLLRALVELARKREMTTALASPTGRAAKRMSETSGMEAKTIHRLLEYNMGTHEFLHNGETPIEAELVIIDEASMMDQWLMYSLLQALKPGTHLVLIGDIHQLPPVGTGLPLDDIISSGIVPVVRLSRIYRQDEESDIVKNAYRINNGEMITGNKENKDFFFILQDDPEKITAEMTSLVTSRLAKKYNLDPLSQIQVLTPMKKNTLGTVELNRVLQSVFHRKGTPVKIGFRSFFIGDKVMQIKNDYEKEVYNGDIGFVVSIDKRNNEMAVDFQGRTVLYDFTEVDQLEHAYAVTIHKSQGSEFPAVVIPIHSQHYIMLQRNLLYTAVTRGKELVVLIGSEKAVRRAVETVTSTVRNSLLKERLVKEIKGIG